MQGLQCTVDHPFLVLDGVLSFKKEMLTIEQKLGAELGGGSENKREEAGKEREAMAGRFLGGGGGLCFSRTSVWELSDSACRLRRQKGMKIRVVFFLRELSELGYS